MAKYGGPIAITNNKEFFNIIKRQDNSLQDNICFYNATGSLMLKHMFKYEEKLVGFDFLENEALFAILESGKYYLIDPFKGIQKTHTLHKRFKRDLIREAKVFENGFAFYT